MKTPPPLNRFFVDPQPTEEQLAAEWGRIRQRLGDAPPGRTAGRRGRTAVLALAAGVIVAAVTAYVTHRGTLVDGGSTVTAIEGPSTRTLIDGSRVMIADGGKIRIAARKAELIQIMIDEGEAEFDVTHRPDRSFVVSAADLEVRVVGTRFRVRIEQSNPGARSNVRVSVTRGAVEVSRASPSVPVRVAAGEERLFGPESSTLDRPWPEASGKSPTAFGATGREASGHEDAQRLFQQANLARRAGQTGEAAGLYDALLTQFPSDPRGGIAALELGRLRMDTLRDLPGAADALRRAVKMLPTGSLHEDAQARLVDAMDGLHDGAACRHERAEYLARYPHGIHATAVNTRCAAR